MMACDSKLKAEADDTPSIVGALSIYDIPNELFYGAFCGQKTDIANGLPH